MTLRNMVILFLATTKVFLQLLDNFLFVERGADMLVNPIELFRGSLTYVIGPIKTFVSPRAK